MADKALQIAKREMQSLVANRGVWVALVAVGAILGLAGPFGTDDAMRLVPRLVYWIALACFSFFLGSAVATTVAEGLRARAAPRWLAVATAGIAAGIANFAALLAINWAVFGLTLADTGPILGLGLNVVVISIIIAVAYVVIERQITAAVPPPASTETPAPPRLLDRLPLEKRGPLLSLSVQDHYTEVATENGRTLVLLRLGDAISEAGDTPGMQVHRSHWVATGAVAAARREGARAVLTLTDGRDIPVSRTYVPALKEAGLLPG